jgi:hypothetical protein
MDLSYSVMNNWQVSTEGIEVAVNQVAVKGQSNAIKTSKYEWWNFIPLNLIEQFRRLANLYFVLIILLQLIPGISPFPIVTSIAPVVFILFVSALKEAIEDFGRHKSDTIINNTKHLQLFSGGEYKQVLPRNSHIKFTCRNSNSQNCMHHVFQLYITEIPYVHNLSLSLFAT